MFLLRDVTILKRMIDVVLNIDSLMLDDDETVDDVIDCLKEKFSFGYEPTYEVLYEEEIADD